MASDGGKSAGLLGTRAAAIYHVLLFFVGDGACGRAGFMVVAAGCGFGGAGDVLLVVALAEHLVYHLVHLLPCSLQFHLTLAVPPAVAPDLADGAIGLEHCHLLWHIGVQRDGHVGGELLLRLPVLLEEMEVVGLDSMRLPEFAS